MLIDCNYIFLGNIWILYIWTIHCTAEKFTILGENCRLINYILQLLSSHCTLMLLTSFLAHLTYKTYYWVVRHALWTTTGNRDIFFIYNWLVLGLDFLHHLKEILLRDILLLLHLWKLQRLYRSLLTTSIHTRSFNRLLILLFLLLLLWGCRHEIRFLISWVVKFWWSINGWSILINQPVIIQVHLHIGAQVCTLTWISI